MRYKILLTLFNIISMFSLTSCKEEVVFEKNEITYETNQIVIDIKGGVLFPGIYNIEEGSLLIDVIKLAGGLQDTADLSNVNLAMPLSNNQMIVIPFTTTNMDKNNPLININTCSIEDLKKIPGIGDAKAKNIIDYRIENGYFTSIEELKKVKGINENLFNEIKTMVTL